MKPNFTEKSVKHLYVSKLVGGNFSAIDNYCFWKVTLKMSSYLNIPFTKNTLQSNKHLGQVRDKSKKRKKNMTSKLELR